MENRELKGIKKNSWVLPVATALGALSVLSSDSAEAGRRRVIIQNRPPQIPLIKNDQPIRIRGNINININLGNPDLFESSRSRQEYNFGSEIPSLAVQQCQNIVSQKEMSDIINLPPERNLTNFVYIADKYFSTDPRVCDAGDPYFLRLAREVRNLRQNSNLMNSLTPSNQRYLDSLSNMVSIITAIENRRNQLDNIFIQAGIDQELNNIESELGIQEDRFRANNQARRVLRDTSTYNRSAVGTFNRLSRIFNQSENRRDERAYRQLIRNNKVLFNLYKKYLQINQEILGLQNQGRNIILDIASDYRKLKSDKLEQFGSADSPTSVFYNNSTGNQTLVNTPENSGDSNQQPRGKAVW